MGLSLSIETLLPLRWRLWLGKLLFAPLGPSTVRVGWNRVLKGPCDPPEVEAMEYVASHTKIPIPTIYAIHTIQKRFIYIEMAYIRGDTLDQAWSNLTQDQRDGIFVELKQHISSLRSLQPPSENLVSSALGNPAYDCRIGARFFGPLNHDDFHSLARGHLRKEDVSEFLSKEVDIVHTSHYRTCFTHADLAPRNIIISDDRIAAILDWGFSGWYPEYWEFTKAHYNYFSDDWEDCLRQALSSYETELGAEQTLWARLPEPGTPATYYRNGKSFQRQGSAPSSAWRNARAAQPKDLWFLALS